MPSPKLFALLLFCASLSHAQTFNFSLSAPGISASGTFTTTVVSGTERITSISGTQNGAAISLLPVGVYGANDNGVSATSPFLTLGGTAFTLANDPNQYNIYFWNGTYYQCTSALTICHANGSGVPIMFTLDIAAQDPPTCGSSAWEALSSSEYYHLPAWMTTPGPAPLTWVQPADVMYQATEYVWQPFPITAWSVSGSTVTFQAVNQLTAGEKVLLNGFKLTTIFDGKILPVLSTGLSGTQFEVTLAGVTGSSEAGNGNIQVPAAVLVNDVVLPAIAPNTASSYLYCSWLLVEGGTQPYTYSGSNLPPGLSVDPATGFYGGIATQPGLYPNIIFCAKDYKGAQTCLRPRLQQVCSQGSTSCNGSGN